MAVYVFIDDSNGRKIRTDNLTPDGLMSFIEDGEYAVRGGLRPPNSTLVIVIPDRSR